MARRLGLTEGAVRSHAEGRADPRPKVKERYREVYGVPLEAWSVPEGAEVSSAPPPTPKAAPPTDPRPPPSAEPSKAPDALTEVVELLAATKRQLMAAEKDANAPYESRATLIRAATQLCNQLARLTGSLEVTQATIVRSAAWSRILRAFEESFREHPEAAKALATFAERLEELGS